MQTGVIARLLPSAAARWAALLFVLAGGAYLAMRYAPPVYMTRLAPVPTPQYLERGGGSYMLAGHVRQLPTYLYALLTPFATQGVRLSAWPQGLFGAGWLVAFSLFMACISYIDERIRFYIALGAAVMLSVVLLPDAVAGTGWQGWALRGLVLGANAGLPYFFNQWRSWVGLPIRFGAIVVANLSWFAALAFLPGAEANYALWAGYATFPMLVLGLLWVFQLAYMGPYWLLQGAVRQSANPALVFGIAMMLWGGNILLAYLQATGGFHGAFYVPDTGWLLLVLTLAGIGPYQEFVEADSNWFTVSRLARPLWLAWAAMGFCFLALASATENISLAEVIEDGTNLSIIGVTVGFLFYVYVNFGTVLAKGLRVDRVLLQPSTLPISAVMAVGATGVLMFFLNANKFPFYQAQAGYYTAIADGHFVRTDYQAADVYYLQALDGEAYAYHPNYMLAQLARAKNRQDDELAYLKTATEVKGQPAGFIELAARYAADGRFFYQLDAMRGGIAKYPTNEALLTDMTLVLAATKLQDSATYYARRLQAAHGHSAAVQNNLSGLAALGRLPASFAAKATNANAWLAQHVPCPAGALAIDSADFADAAAFINLYNQVATCPAAAPGPSGLDSLAHLAAAQGQPGFAEDLLYQRALGLWRGGSTVSALEQIQALARPSSYSRGVYYATAFGWAIMAANPHLALQFAASAAKGGAALPAKDSLLAAALDQGTNATRYPEANQPAQLPHATQFMARLQAERNPAVLKQHALALLEAAPFSPEALRLLDQKRAIVGAELLYPAVVRAYQLDRHVPALAQLYINLCADMGLDDFYTTAKANYKADFNANPQ